MRFLLRRWRWRRQVIEIRRRRRVVRVWPRGLVRREAVRDIVVVDMAFFLRC